MHFPLADLLQGILIGVLISIPLGPVGLITMKRTAEYGLRAGIISGLAIVLIDTSIAALLLLGLHESIPYLRHLPGWLHILGGILILIYGIRILLTAPLAYTVNDLPWHKHFVSSIIIAITNPSTYVSFGVIGLLLSRFVEQPLFTRIEVMIGFFIGALLWWCFLAYLAFTQRERYYSTTGLQRVVGFIIIFLAILTLFGPYNIHAARFSFLTQLL